MLQLAAWWNRQTAPLPPQQALILEQQTVKDSLTVGGRRPLIRAVERWPALSLKPEKSSWDSFEAFLHANDEEVDDVEWAAELYLTMCELTGEPRQTEVGGPEFAETDEIEFPAEPVTTKTLLAPDESASRFAEWLRLSGNHGDVVNDRLTTLYAEHCEAEDLVEISGITLRKALKAVPGVSKRLADICRTKRGGKPRFRPTIWTIAPYGSVEETPPWTELPASKAA